MDSAIRSFVAVVSIVLMAACATSDATAPVEAALRIEQLPDEGFAVEDRGAISVAYQMSVQNRSADPITLRKIEMQTMGRSPYTLRNEPVILNETIEPGTERNVTFTMWSYSREQRSSRRTVVWVTGVAHFDRAQGSFTVPFTESFREP